LTIASFLRSRGRDIPFIKVTRLGFLGMDVVADATAEKTTTLGMNLGNYSDCVHLNPPFKPLNFTESKESEVLNWRNRYELRVLMKRQDKFFYLDCI